MKNAFVLPSRLALLLLLSLSLSQAVAQTPIWQGYVQPPPRECTLPAGTGSVRIIAGPDSNSPSGLAAAFPSTEPCPTGFGGMCRKWEYAWVYKGVNPSHSLVSADADIQVLLAEPTAVTIPPIVGDTTMSFGVNVAGEVGFRFNANQETYLARIWTPVTASVGTVTAGFQSGNRRGFCPIAGAGSLSGDAQLSLATRTETSTLGCTVVWTLSPDGCPVSAEVTGGPCTIRNSDLGLNTNAASCGTELNVPGSTQVCRYNSILRTYTCVVLQ